MTEHRSPSAAMEAQVPLVPPLNAQHELDLHPLQQQVGSAPQQPALVQLPHAQNSLFQNLLQQHVGPTPQQPALVQLPHAQYSLFFQHLHQQSVGPAPQQPPLVPPHHDQDGPYVRPPPADPLHQPAQHFQWPSPQAPSLCQPHPPVPHDQQLPCMHASPPRAPPQGSGPDAEQIAVLQTVSNTWKGLDLLIHTARSLKACVDLWKDTLLRDTVAQGLMVAVASLEETIQELEQWMRGSDGWDPVELARAGRLRCLQRLHKEGRFLDLYSPLRASAGEARRAEVWLAALAACKAGHADVLRWLFRGGWPHSFDADPPWHLRDMAEAWIKQFGTVLRQESLCVKGTFWWLQPELTSFPPEVELYCTAMREPACLDALLEAGARSPWICRAAVLKGRADLLRVKVARGCPCDAECLFSAAREGQVAALEEVLGLGLDLLLETTNRLLPHGGSANVLERSAAILVQQAGMEAAARGQEACLEALLRWHPDLLCASSAVADAAAQAGSLNCLQLLHRAGFKEWRGITSTAAGKPDNVPCLRFALQLDPPSGGSNPNARDPYCYYPTEQAASAGSLANLKALHEAGCHWTGSEVDFAIESWDEDVVSFCLKHCVDHGGFNWYGIMAGAAATGGGEIMKLLYDSGFPPHCMTGKQHPAVLAIAQGNLEATQIAVEYSGVPEQHLLDTQRAIWGEEALLRYVHGLGGTLHKGTAVAAIEGNKLECLRYAHEGGCLKHTPEEQPGFPAARSLPILRYVCEHMGPTWRAGVLRETARQLADSKRWATTWERLDWQMALYTVQQFVRSGEPGMQWEDLPAPLAEAVLVRRERAAALAGAFFKAGQLAQVWPAHSWAPVWRSMAALPSELLQRIAFMAHLVLPPAPLC